jgi:hypothetical protein
MDTAVGEIVVEDVTTFGGHLASAFETLNGGQNAVNEGKSSVIRFFILSSLLSRERSVGEELLEPIRCILVSLVEFKRK